MGPKLYSVFKAAGLPAPEMRADALIGGPESVAPALVAGAARMVIPHLEELGIAAEADVDVDTLEDRMRADLERSGGVMSAPPLIGAWVRLAD